MAAGFFLSGPAASLPPMPARSRGWPHQRAANGQEAARAGRQIAEMERMASESDGQRAGG